MNQIGWTAALLALVWAGQAMAVTEVRLATHDSFSLPKELLAEFEHQNDAKITILKMGDGNELLNKLIISKRKPIADAVYGLDNGNIVKAIQEGILADKQPTGVKTVVSLPQALVVDYGFIAINYDKQWFANKKLPLPKSLDDLTKPAYKNLLVTPNPNTSTPAFGFFMANIGGLGEENAFDWWKKMRENGVKVTKGWSEAYYTEFTLNGGSRPMMVGYATSPAAEVFYSEGKLKQPRMGNLFLAGGNYRQMEGVAVLNGAAQPKLAAKLAQYLQSPKVQAAVPTNMWMYPAVRETPLPDIMNHATAPTLHYSPNAKRIQANRQTWLNRWSKVVVK